MNRIAVTGASGFVGRSLVSRLKRDRCEFVAITRGSTDAQSSLDCSVCFDYQNTALLSDLFSGFDVVIHLAARAHQLSEIFDDSTPNLYHAANVNTLLSVARAARDSGVKRLVFVSSIGVNGSATNGRPFIESDPPMPVGPYAISKLKAEQALAIELADGETDWVVLRPPLVYGPGCPGNLQSLIRLVYTAPFLPFGSLHARRTLISIENLLDALLIAACHPAVSRRTFVISDDRDIDVASMIDVFLEGLGRGSWRLIPVPTFLIGWLLDIFGKKFLWKKLSGELLVDPSAFRQATGWVPVVTPRVGLRKTAEAAFSLR